MANEARLLIRADDQASKALRDVAGEANKAAKPLSDIGKIAAGFVVGQGLMKLPGLFSSTVSAASDLAEAGSKVNVVFGPDAVEVTQFAKLADNIGLSDAAALSATGTFGNLFVSMGMPTKEAATMSMEIVELAADLASFNNIEIADALQKLQAGLVGETEPLRALGVNLSAAAIEAKAMELGLADAEGALTAADKATASYKLILEQTQTAQGDFERTSDGLANKQRILKADIADLQAEIGQKLVPAMAAGVDGMGKMVDVAGDIPMGTAAIVGLGTTAAIVAPKLLALGRAAQAASGGGLGLASAFKTAPGVIGAVTVGLVALDLALEKFTGEGLMDRVLGSDSEAGQKALDEWDAKLAAAGGNADKAAIAAGVLAEANSELTGKLAAAAAETGDFGDLLLDLNGIFTKSKGQEVVDGFDDIAASVKLAGQQMRAADAPTRDMIAAYQQLNPELRDAFDAGSNIVAIWTEQTGGLTGLANVLPEVAEAYAAMKPAQDASATATGHWADAIEDAEKKAKALDEAIGRLNGRFAELDPIYQALQSKAALYNEELDDLKAKGDSATESDKARIETLEELLKSIEDQTTAMDSNKTAVAAQQQALETLMGPQGYETFQRKLAETKLSLEEQTDVTGKVADAYGDLTLNDLPAAMQKFDEMKGSLAPEVWQPIAQGLGPKLVEAIRTGVADPGEQAKLYQEVWNMMTAGLSAAETAALGASEIGRQIVNGIASGIRENAYLIVNAAAAAAKIPMTEFAAQLEIQSPSRVMAEEVGKPIIQGVVAGMIAEAPALMNIASQLAAATGSLMKQAVGGKTYGEGGIQSLLSAAMGASNSGVPAYLQDPGGWGSEATYNNAVDLLLANGGQQFNNLKSKNPNAGWTGDLDEDIKLALAMMGGVGGGHADVLSAAELYSNQFEKNLLGSMGGEGGWLGPKSGGGIIQGGAGAATDSTWLSAAKKALGSGAQQPLVIMAIDAASFREWLNRGGGDEIMRWAQGRKVFA